MSTNPFEQFFGPGPSGYGPPWASSPPVEEKGVAWDAKDIAGELYVPLEQVAELLKNNNILPKMQGRIEANVQAAKDKKKFGI